MIATTESTLTFSEQRALVMELIDTIEAAADDLGDEYLVWLASFVLSVGDGRPLKARDPWSLLLHSMQPGRERPGEMLPPLIHFAWFGPHSWRGFCHSYGGTGRFKIALRQDLARVERRAVLAHELAHVDLTMNDPGHLSRVRVDRDRWSDPVERSAYLAEERRTDARAAELFDVDMSVLGERV